VKQLAAILICLAVIAMIPFASAGQTLGFGTPQQVIGTSNSPALATNVVLNNNVLKQTSWTFSGGTNPVTTVVGSMTIVIAGTGTNYLVVPLFTNQVGTGTFQTNLNDLATNISLSIGTQVFTGTNAVLLSQTYGPN
jgi:hypothetical protein